MKVSIAMATYNGAPYLGQQLESFRLQERLPDELVISDDASTDGTRTILDAFAGSAPFTVRIHQNPVTLGYPQNFSAALSLCSGDLVFLSDQDDYWFVSKIATVVSLAQSDSRTQLFINDAELTDEHLNPTGLTKLGQIRSAWMSDEAFVQGSCVAVRRQFLDLVLPVPRDHWSHDAWIVTFARGLGRMRIVPQTLQYYRRHSSNMSQFIVNQPRELPRVRLLLRKLPLALNTDRRGALQRQLAQTKVCAARIGDLLAARAVNDTDPDLTGDLERLSLLLAARMNALRGRLALLEKPRALRIPGVTAMLCRGGYADFGQAKGAGQDLLAPSSRVGLP
jgi:glycosyltransferase involved in cell wall biosynthesis